MISKAVTPLDFNNSLIPGFSPRWSCITKSFESKEQKVGSELARAFRNTEGPSLPSKVSGCQCKMQMFVA